MNLRPMPKSPGPTPASSSSGKGGGGAPQFTQDGRPARATTPLGKDKLLLDRLTGEESLSAPFLYTLHLLSLDDGIDAKALVRKPVSVAVDLPDGSQRQMHGLVRRFVQGDRGDELVSYRAEVVPWLWFLSLGTDCRWFQEKTVPEIVTEVFKELGYNDFQLRLTATYEKRDYVVQYRESHLDFVSRLLEEEGIFYFFEHTAERHLLVLADALSAVRPCPGQDRAKLRRQADWTSLTDTQDVVLSFHMEQVARTGSVATTDYNFTTPMASLGATSTGAEPEERFEFPGRYGVREHGDRYARMRLEAIEADSQVARVQSKCRAFLPGYRFTLEDHYRRDLNKAYQIVQVRHALTNVGYTSADQTAFEYDNEVIAIPYTVPYRPPRGTRRPVVRGTQSAVVVGPKGEEIYVDKYGRVKVQFHWDRRGKKDEGSSCWVRVASPWAGKNWGFVQIPRIGQEVLVDFLEGDPDHPVIIGRVYNAENMPPYDLPANQTQSGLKTRSSKGGGTEDFNELRFEDKKGAEEIYLHAQKDWTTMVENDRKLDVGHDETITVKNDRTKTVEGNETTEVAKNRTETVKGDEKIEVKMTRATKVGSSDKLEVGTSLDVDAGTTITLTANTSITLQVGGTSIKLTQSGIEITGTSSVKMMGASGVELQGGKVGVQGGEVSVQGGKVGIMGGLVTIN
jgi:type VI secretion system secreted protein VgrG